MGTLTMFVVWPATTRLSRDKDHIILKSRYEELKDFAAMTNATEDFKHSATFQDAVARMPFSSAPQDFFHFSSILRVAPEVFDFIRSWLEVDCVATRDFILDMEGEDE